MTSAACATTTWRVQAGGRWGLDRLADPSGWPQDEATTQTESVFLGCRAIGRYEDVIISLRANVFEDRWLMIADFQRVLEAMDQRIVTVNQGDK